MVEVIRTSTRNKERGHPQKVAENVDIHDYKSPISIPIVVSPVSRVLDPAAFKKNLDTHKEGTWTSTGGMWTSTFEERGSVDVHNFSYAPSLDGAAVP